MYLGKSLYIQRFFANGNYKESTFISTSETTLKIHKCSLTEVLAHVQLQTAKLSHRYILGCGLFIFFVPLLIHFPAIPNLIIFWDLKISMTVGYYVDISNPAIIFWWGYNLKVLTFTKKKKKKNSTSSKMVELLKIWLLISRSIHGGSKVTSICNAFLFALKKFLR